MKLYVREGVRVHDIHCGPKSYKLKLLGKLVVQLFLIVKMLVFCEKREKQYFTFHEMFYF